MPRLSRHIEAGTIYHVLNRGNGRRSLFNKPADFDAFVKLIAQALAHCEVDLLAFCLMGNHWHLLLRPRRADALSRMMAWLTVTHARRHHQHYPNPGTGHLYQGRFKSFPVQSDEHFLTVVRYIHANPLRAGLVQRAQAWRWSDLTQAAAQTVRLSDWPIERPRGWIRLVNQMQPKEQVHAVEASMKRGTPLGSAMWVEKIAARSNLRGTLRPRGRPKRPLDSLTPRYRRQRERKEADKSG